MNSSVVIIITNQTTLHSARKIVFNLMLGVIVGFSVGSLIVLMLTCGSGSIHHLSLASGARGAHEAAADSRHRMRRSDDDDDVQGDMFEPRIHLNGKPPRADGKARSSSSNASSVVARPRYVAEELSIRHKLFVAILSTTPTLASPLAIMHNRSFVMAMTSGGSDGESHSGSSKLNNRLTFFSSNAAVVSEQRLAEITPAGISLVNFNDGRIALLPLHAIKYIADNHVHAFDWYFFALDTTFWRANKLLSLVSHMSIAQDVYMGVEETDTGSPHHCNMHAGIVFSSSMIRKLGANIDRCIQMATSVNDNDDSSSAVGAVFSENVGRCVLNSSSTFCHSRANGQEMSAHQLTAADNNIDVSSLSSRAFNGSLSVYPARSASLMKALSVQYGHVDTLDMERQMDALEERIVATARTAAEAAAHTTSTACAEDAASEASEECREERAGEASLRHEQAQMAAWPIGVPAPYRPTNRHEVIRHDYFNATHVMLAGDLDVCDEMSDAYKRDIDELVAYSLRRLSANDDHTTTNYTLLRLLNGYKQFDPTRGASYILDLMLVARGGHASAVHRRVELMRPLGLVEILSMPYVAETALVHVLVAFTRRTGVDELTAFFKAFRQLVLDTPSAAADLKRLRLHVVFVERPIDATTTTDSNDIEALLNATIVDLNSNYSSSLTKTTTTPLVHQARVVQSRQQSEHEQVALAEYASANLASADDDVEQEQDPLVLVVPVCVELHAAFLNRVRLNTVRRTQVFFAIPFAQYMPDIVYEEERRRAAINGSLFHVPDLVQMHKNVGHFDTHSYEFAAFYLHDYVRSAALMWRRRRTTTTTMQLAEADLYDIFEANTELNVMRANDEALRCRWRPLVDTCQAGGKEDEHEEECRERLETSFGTKAQLANHLLQITL